MRQWFCVACLAVGSAWVTGCDKQAGQQSIALVDDSPILGVWYMQADGDRPVPIGSTIRFDFKPGGEAAYERSAGGPEEPDTLTLGYNLAGDIISIDGQADAPGVPRITGQVEFTEDGNALRITTHDGENWLLTREAMPGGDIEDARRVKQIDSKTDDRLSRVQQLAYACIGYANRTSSDPQSVMDLIEAGLIRPEQLTASGLTKDLPARFTRMDDRERADWFSANSAYAFFYRYSGTGQASSVLVCTLPQTPRSDVVVGMANGAVFKKPAIEAAQLLLMQTGSLPPGWPDAARTTDASAGLEPLGD